ncbi:MAG: magnesium transporter [Acidobacteriales bacterium]|nr:magnesium transporter [Terriglobales bacterium]
MVSMLALTDLLGLPVYDPSGAECGRVRELALAPGEDRAQVAMMVVRNKKRDFILPSDAVKSIDGSIRALSFRKDWSRMSGSEGFFMLGRDLLDQQIIDVDGRKVVRVNDVDLHRETGNGCPVLKVGSVDVGARGAVRRLLKGVVPHSALLALLHKIPARTIPWEFVDLIEIDPARRVKLKISHERLARLHPADIADIVEELAPSEREAVFETLDDELAAEALEEVSPRVQKSIVESLESDRVAEIVEEMNPDAAADLLADLPTERTSEILLEMGPEQRKEMVELLEFGENTAAGRMNTDYLAVNVEATAQDAIEALRQFEGGVESVATVYLTKTDATLVGAVPLAKIVLAPPDTPLSSLTSKPLISCKASARENEVAELFDKYNLVTLPVVDDDKKLTGVVTSDDVISMLRATL